MTYKLFRNILILLSVFFGFQQCAQKPKDAEKRYVPTEKDMSAYLMVFHTDETHSLHMAISWDGYTFTALNDAKPVIKGDTIAMQKGIRDPHIFRGPDGAFYLAMTDLHIYAQREGYRETEWERKGEDYGWGNRVPHQVY